MQVIFSFPLASLWYLWKWIINTIEGVSSVTNFITAYKESLKTRFPFSVCNVLFVPKGNPIDLFYFTAAGVIVVWRPKNVSMYFTIVQIIFSFPLGSMGPLWYLWRWSSAHVYASGRKQCCKLHYCLWRVPINPRLPFSVCNGFFVSKVIRLDFYLSVIYMLLVMIRGWVGDLRTDAANTFLPLRRLRAGMGSRCLDSASSGSLLAVPGRSFRCSTFC